jgi:predicted esterase YcpF (UPF0227 family)
MKLIIETLKEFINLSPSKKVNVLFVLITTGIGYLYYQEKSEHLATKEKYELEKKAYVSRLLVLNSKIDNCIAGRISDMVDCEEKIKANNDLRISELKEHKEFIKMYKRDTEELYKKINTK